MKEEKLTLTEFFQYVELLNERHLQETKEMIEIVLSGKAHLVFRYLALLAKYQGKKTLGEL